MIYLFTIIFPIISIGLGLWAFYATSNFVKTTFRK
jgi:hypothetical protein